MIYLDNNATTRLDLQVAGAMSECMEQQWLNPASSHRLGQAARKRLEQARHAIADQLGVRLDVHPPDRLLFCSGATEANHLAIRGIAARRPGAIVVSRLEHPSVIGAAEQLQRDGREVRFVQALPTGQVDLDHLRDSLAPPVAVAALMLVNNETGVIQPIQQAVELCREASAPLHCDAVQAIGKLPVNFRELDVDSLAWNAHKIHGPVGIGALAVRAGVELAPLMQGGGQQLGTRPGTESIPLAVGLEAALDQWLGQASQRRQRLLKQRGRLEQQLCEVGGVVHGLAVERSPTTISVSFPGIDRQELLMALDFSGVACSTGSACASGSSEPSPVLQAMGLPSDQVESAIRLSLGCDTTDQDIAQGAATIAHAVQRLRR